VRRRLGLRPRLLAALRATSLVTLGAAAIVLLGPLRDRLRQESVQSTRNTVNAEVGEITDALADNRCNDLFGLVLGLQGQTGADVYVLDVTATRGACDFKLLPSLDASGDLAVQTALTDGTPSETVRGTDLEQVMPLRYTVGKESVVGGVLLVRKPLRDVAGAVEEVRRAFEKAAIIGLVAVLILGLFLASTMVRRLERLRRAALRVTTEGAGAPQPNDEGSDEIGDLARSFAAMQQSLLAQEEARKAFVATASHELRTPLTSLSGMLELLDEDLEEGRLDVADAQQQIAAARRELRRLRNLAAELLDLSRLDAGVELRSEPVELGELVRAVASEFEQRAGDAGVTIDAVPPIGPCWAKGDPQAIARVLRILLDNGLRFSPSGEAIRVVAHYSGEHAQIEVSDAGPGVPPAERELVFNRFQRGSSTGGEGGFGLGLAIGRELAERMGGTLELADSEQGACFVLALPASPSSPSPSPAPDSAAAA
jgi:signal transduction histidine kinase